MKNNFNFTIQLHDFWPIYNAIKKFYPIGIRGAYPSIYFEYPGIKELEAKITSSFSDSNELSEKWRHLMNSLKSKFPMEIRDTTFGNAPSYSLEIVLETISATDLTRFKKICISVSILEKFYTIYGIDESHIKVPSENGSSINLKIENAVIISPFNEFKIAFTECLNILKSLFTLYKIVPIAISAMTIEGLQVRYLDKVSDVTIYNALFNQFLEFRNLQNMLGDKSFGYTEWKV